MSTTLFILLSDFDDRLFAFLHAYSSASFDTVCELFSNIGHGRCIGIILAALILFFSLKRDWYSLLTVLCLVPGMLLTELAKELTQRPRPDPFTETGFSFPCGHLLTSVLAYGMVLLTLYPYLKTPWQRHLACGTTGLLIFLIGFGRLASGAHYFTDAVAGLLFAFFWLPACVKFTSYLKHHRPLPAHRGHIHTVPIAVPMLVLRLRPTISGIPNSASVEGSGAAIVSYPITSNARLSLVVNISNSPTPTVGSIIPAPSFQ